MVLSSPEAFNHVLTPLGLESTTIICLLLIIDAQDVQRKTAQDQMKAQLEQQKLAQQAQLKREEMQQEEELKREEIRSEEDIAVLKTRAVVNKNTKNDKGRL